MMRPARLVLALCVMSLLSGCSYLNSLTGQTDNTVLPGQREEAIPGRPSFPEKPDTQVGSTSKAPAAQPLPGAGCAANDPGCKPPATTGDTFKDPQ